MRPISIFLIAAALALPQTVSAQLLPEQRSLDFQNLVALYAKRYAPYDWKKQALGFDALDIKAWITRVLAAKDDLEFFEIEAEYVAKLQDTHSGFQMTSSFRAYLGGQAGSNAAFTVDIYDGKVLIDGIQRSLLPTATYPFQIGDELVSIDGIAVDDWIARISTWRQFGNPATTRRMAVGQLVVRSQSTFPHAIDIGDTSTIQIRRQSGAVENYTLRWTKTGVPVTTVGPVPFPKPASLPESSKVSEAEPDLLRALDELHNYKLPNEDHAYALNFGSPLPIFRSGLPTNFAQRLGRSSSEFHFSGTYTSNGLTIGYLRVPSFTPSNTTATIAELKAEIDYMQRNTDGLVVDVMRNPGGGCYMIDLAAALTPFPFYFFGEQIRATQSQLNSFQSLLEFAKLVPGTEQWVIDTYQSYVDQVKAALAANRGMTDPIAACKQTGSSAAPVRNGNPPGSAVYTKPIIVLIDELSISAADIFPSMIQDNGRALLVGTRSSGGGGSVSSWPTGMYSESISNNTNTLVVRKSPIKTAEYPEAPYVENIGARPDVLLDYMTKDNLLNGGRPFVDQFTQVLVNVIKAGGTQAATNTFSISERGGVSLSTPGAAGQPVIGYGRIQSSAGSTTPSGLAIFGYRPAGILVSEATVPATPRIQSGRIYAEINGAVNTGLAIANPNPQAATVSFYFTGAQGNFAGGSFNIPAYGQTAAFLDQSPFNGGQFANGTFTFTSTTPVAVIALRGFTNERKEFLITTLPVVDLSVTPLGGTPESPHFADGEGWTTQMALVNPTDSTITGQIIFRNPAGATVFPRISGSTNQNGYTFSIPPRASQRLSTLGVSSPLQSGSVVVVPDSGNVAPVALAIFSYRLDGITVTEAGVPAMSAATAYRLYGEASGDFVNRAPGSIQTGIAVVNRSNSTVTMTVQLNRLDGSPAGFSGTIPVPAAGQAARFLNQITGLESLPLPFQGIVRVSSPAPMSVIGLRGRYNERNDFLITTIPPVNEALSPTSNDLFFPDFVDAGGYTTQFILFSGSAGQQSTGALSFFNQAGNSVNLTLR